MFVQVVLQLRIALAGLTALAVSFVSGSQLIRVLKKRQVTEDVTKPDAKKLGELHAKKKNTPTMGGLMILVGLVVAVLLWADLTNVYVALGLLLTAWLGMVGFADDALKLRYKRTGKGPRGLNKKTKLALQGLIGLAVGLGVWLHVRDSGWGTRLYIPFLSRSGLEMGWGLIPWVAIVIVATSNSVNITDGLDGLAAGCTAITALALAGILAAAGNQEWSDRLQIIHVPDGLKLCVFVVALLAATLAFLWYNCHPADIFMGDTGSLVLGGLLGYFAVAVKQEFLLILVGFVFVGDMLSVLLQVLAFKTTGKRIFRIAPYHHSLEYRGWPETKITVRLWILAAVTAAFGMAALGMR